nr:hypothetical protein FVER53263_13802 [Fusarium verticillioides]
MSENHKDFQIAIIGDGIAGIVLAISLLKRNIPCKIYERAHALSDIGAGLGISPNAQDAMATCDPSVHEAFRKVANGNTWESKKNFLFEFLDGMDGAATDSSLSHIENRTGLQGCHRGAFVNELIKLLPGDVVQFNKQLQTAEEDSSGGIRLVFQDGSIEEADAVVVGCDGIRSKVREILFGVDHPSSKCPYTHKYAYRGMIPMKQAVEVLGEERALNATMWLGKDKNLLSYPVAHGTILNVVAYCSSSDDWPSECQLVLPATKEDLLHDFEGFRPSVLKILDNTERLDRWAIFDLGDNPVPTFVKGRELSLVCLNRLMLLGVHLDGLSSREGQAYCLYLQVKYLYHDYNHYANSTQNGSKELKEYWKGCAPWFNAAYMSKAKDTVGTYQALAMQDFVNTDLKATPPCISKAVFFLFGDKDSGNTSPCIVDVQTIAAKCGAENPRALKGEHLRDLTPQQLQAIYEAKVPILKNLFSANDPLLDFLRA